MWSLTLLRTILIAFLYCLLSVTCNKEGEISYKEYEKVVSLGVEELLTVNLLRHD